MQGGKMIKFSINGKELEVEPGTTIIRAAEKAGIAIPRFCWHPALSIAGNCRMCLVKIEKNPKLQISCNTTAAEGMVVSTDTEEVKEAVRGVLEFILINHPLDCPICDQAGECWLQNYYMDNDLDYYGLLYRMKQKTRYNVGLAERRGVHIRHGELADLPLLYRMYAATSVRDHFVIRDEGYYQDAWGAFIAAGLAQALIAEVGGEPVAGLIVYRFADKAWYLYGMSTDRHRVNSGLNT
jgi:ferredoxin